MSHDTAAELNVAYLVSQYPALSHVFIEREIEGLRDRGASVKTYSVRPTAADGLLSEAMRDESLRTTVLLESRARIVMSLLRLARAHPGVLAAALRRATRTGEPTLRNRLRQLFYLAEAVHLHEDMRARGLRHVHVHFANNGADVARLAVEIGRAVDGPGSAWRWTLTMHGPGEFAAEERMDLAGKVTHAVGVACISDFTRSQLMKLATPASWGKFTVVRMSVDTKRFRPPLTPRIHTGPLRVLYVGRLVSEKGGPILISAVEQLRDSGIEVELVMIGSGPLLPELEGQIAERGLQKYVTMAGAVGQDEILEHYWWADVFCLPSFQEGLPVVLMEAMATELPVITTRIAGIPELVNDGHNGVVVSAGRSDLIADAVARLEADPELRSRLGARGRADVCTSFSMDETSGDQLDFLTQAQRMLPS